MQGAKWVFGNSRIVYSERQAGRMYQLSFLFIIISGSPQMEGMLRGIEPLEDCEYTFRTVSCPQDAGADAGRLDAAFIFDGVHGAEFPKELEGHKECVLVAKGGNPLLLDPAAVSAFSGVWIMPESEDYDKGLMTAYFQQLAERMKERADGRKQKICFETLIDSVPDIAWFKDVGGRHMIVNASFCEMVGKTKEQIYKQGHCYIWDASKADEEVCLKSDRIIMDSRQTNTFEEDIKAGANQRRIRSYKSALIDEDGEIFGTCGIGHDVTEVQNMNAELDIVLDGIPYIVLIEDLKGIVWNKNIMFDKYFPGFMDIVGKSSAEWKALCLSKKVFMEDIRKDVVVLPGKQERILVLNSEPMFDIFNRVIGKIITLTDITVERSIVNKNQRIANTDYLTGLNNRRNLMSHLEGMQNIEKVTLLMIDLDNFKGVNDNFGHEAGDRALIKTAEVLKECFPTDFIARMGGDEFLVVVEGKDPDHVEKHAKRLQEQLRKVYGAQREFQGVGASIGIVSAQAVPESLRTVANLVQISDDLLYEAKNRGKNCYCIYQAD